MNYQHEENNYPKAFAATGVILAAIMLLCYFIVFHTPPPQEDGTGGILVNYGTVDEGMGNDYMNVEEPSMAENANNTKPDKVTPTPPTEQKSQTDDGDDVLTQNNEDAPEVTPSSKKPTNTVATTPTKPDKKPTVNSNALYKGPTNGASGEGDGTGSTPGNQGKTTGSTLTNNYNGTGSGNGGSSLAMAQRNFVSKPSIDDNGRHTGKVVVDIRVDRNGNVVYCRAGGRGTTISDSGLLQKCEDAVRNSRLNSLETAPDPQIGQVVFVFKVN